MLANFFATNTGISVDETSITRLIVAFLYGKLVSQTGERSARPVWVLWPPERGALLSSGVLPFHGRRAGSDPFRAWQVWPE